ncbi:MAG: DUF3108 domain-containing protein [Deltaproteobacteria bacterium]|nr:DUF3108 domain-containing protein [Deltaproteobacteria bacterium]
MTGKLSAYKNIVLTALLSFAIFYPGVCLPGGTPAAAPVQQSLPKAANIADAFVNEELSYSIGFWLFEGVAFGKVSLKKGENGDYTATLTAHTAGALDRILYHREDTYVAHFRLAEGGRRFVTTSFDKTIESGGKVKKSLTTFHYDRGEMSWNSREEGRGERSGVEKLPPGVYYDDPIGAFYNFRFGVYGPVEEGRKYQIPSFPKKGVVPMIHLRIADRGEFMEANSKETDADYLSYATIDRDLFGSQTGNIEIYFTRGMVPVEAVVKDLIFFGDVRGTLIKEGNDPAPSANR